MAASSAGPLLFARYAFPPNRLGLCGPDDAAILKESADAGASREARHLAEGFEGAYPYLQLIADANGLADPLDRRVVEAYWIGNELTRGVGQATMYRDVERRFHNRISSREWRWVERAVSAGSVPLHAFHVLEIYPRAGLLRGGNPEILPTIDACRIRWGTILAVVGDELLVSSRRLEMIDGLFRLAEPMTERVHNTWRDAASIPRPEPGAAVSLHWGWACELLTPEQVHRLRAWTDFALAIANHGRQPAPAGPNRMTLEEGRNGPWWGSANH